MGRGEHWGAFQHAKGFGWVLKHNHHVFVCRISSLANSFAAPVWSGLVRTAGVRYNYKYYYLLRLYRSGLVCTARVYTYHYYYLLRLYRSGLVRTARVYYYNYYYILHLCRSGLVRTARVGGWLAGSC